MWETSQKREQLVNKSASLNIEHIGYQKHLNTLYPICSVFVVIDDKELYYLHSHYNSL